MATRIWFLTSIFLGIFLALYCFTIGQANNAWLCLIVVLAALITSLPILIVLLIVMPYIKASNNSGNKKLLLLFFLCFISTSIYSVIGAFMGIGSHYYYSTVWHFVMCYLVCQATLFGSCVMALLCSIRIIKANFFDNSILQLSSYSKTNFQNQTNIQMNQSESLSTPFESNQQKANQSNKILIKAAITAGLILLLLIPTFFVQNLVTEREERQKQVVSEVTAKWSKAQTITGPYIYVPYQAKEKDASGKEIFIHKNLIFLPENLATSGSVALEQRPRSIYKVLLYKTSIESKGNFILQLPKEISFSSLNLSNAKICLGITDFKGIAEKVIIQFNGEKYELSPGLPTNQIDSIGLSSSLQLTESNFNTPMAFALPLLLKGSEQLHFVPLSGNSSFVINSTWPNPSFDGNNLPTDRTVSDSGFSAKWVFNKANLPFGTIINNSSIDKKNYAFGVSLVQTADQYAKTMRSVKYAILLIGLSFALFFIIELMQKKPVHPVQYILIGLALIIFYTLLLSISEFLLFDIAYLIAATATILLIVFYAKGHFAKWQPAVFLGLVLSGLYAFVFTLIRLEDTALLVGSIGLFIVLALVMLVSRKINWYNTNFTTNI